MLEMFASMQELQQLWRFKLTTVMRLVKKINLKLKLKNRRFLKRWAAKEAASLHAMCCHLGRDLKNKIGWAVDFFGGEDDTANCCTEDSEPEIPAPEMLDSIPTWLGAQISPSERGSANMRIRFKGTPLCVTPTKPVREETIEDKPPKPEPPPVKGTIDSKSPEPASPQKICEHGDGEESRNDTSVSDCRRNTNYLCGYSVRVNKIPENLNIHGVSHGLGESACGAKRNSELTEPTENHCS